MPSMPEIASLLALDIRKSMLYRPVIEEPYLRSAASELSFAPRLDIRNSVPLGEGLGVSYLRE
jgi:hypothetical protein